jgi:hypothetical protein
MRGIDKRFLQVVGFLSILLVLTVLLIIESDTPSVAAVDARQSNTSALMTASAIKNLRAIPTDAPELASHAGVPVFKNIGIPAIVKQVPAGVSPDALAITKMTEDDVRQHYVKANKIYAQHNKPLLQVVQIEFVSGLEAAKKIGVHVEVPDNASLCLVILTGNFKAAVPPDSNPANNQESYNYSKEFQIFDAYTGNFLMDGELK